MSDSLTRLFGNFDSYARKARLTPALLLLLLLAPVAVVIGAGVPNWPAATSLAVAVVAAGLPIALSDWVRRRGQELQTHLWRKWGGNPVVTALRTDGLIARQRRALLERATGLPVGNVGHARFEEAAENAVRRLISATRDKSRYPLIFAENKAYGFARNLLAVRRMGLKISVTAVITSVLLLGVSTKVEALSVGSTLLGTVGAAIAMAVWLWYPTEERVLAAAHDYRDRLLEALDSGALHCARYDRSDK